MNPPERQVFEVLEQVWTALSGLPVRPRAGGTLWRDDGAFTVAYVGIRGAWQGEVVLACDAELARFTAGRLYEVPPEQVTDAQLRETLAEAGNIVAGNLKRFLPEPSALKLPLVGYGGDLRVRLRLPAPGTTTCAAADCFGWPLLVAVTAHR